MISMNMKLFFFIRRFLEIPSIEKRLLIRGFAFSLICHITAKLFPIKYCFNLIQSNSTNFPKNNDDSSLIVSKRILNRLIRMAPWVRNCFIKALTLNFILNKFGIKSDIILSLRKENNELMAAHAYIIIGNKTILFKKQNFSDVYILRTN